MNNKHIIWQDAIYEDEKYYEDDYREQISSGDFTEEEMSLQDYVNERVSTFYDDEIMNLHKDIPNGIIVIGSLGLWDGRKLAYREKEYNNLNDCLKEHNDNCYLKVYFDDEGELIAEESHHDGTNYLTYREWKDGVTEEQKEVLKDALYYHYTNYLDIMEKYTNKMGHYVAEIYGLEINEPIAQPIINSQTAERSIYGN